MLNPESYEKNTGDVDYLKLTKNGLLVDDGQANLVDEDGNVLISFEAMGLESNEDVLGALRELNMLSDDVMGNLTAHFYHNAMKANGGAIKAPEEMLFLLGAKAEYNARVARGLIDTRAVKNPMKEILNDFSDALGASYDYNTRLKHGLVDTRTVKNPRNGVFGGLIDNLFGMRTKEVAIGFDEWMNKRVNADNFDRLNLEYPTGDLGPWKGLGSDGLLTCTDCSGYRNSNLIAQLTNMTTDRMQQRVEEEGLMSDIRAISNSTRWNYPARFRGNNIGSVFAMMGLGDGVRQYTIKDIQSGALHPGAIATIWKPKFYHTFQSSIHPGYAGWGHTGNVGRVSAINNENGFGVQIPWVDQYNGTELNHKTLKFFSNKGDSWWSTVLLGTHVYNDITPYQFDLGLLKLNTTLYNYNN